ncbi:MAG: PHP domain-containing protein [Ignavibacteriae bacterium]|nr:PHP domain-containing protein [Ignavibacteria bacterium]MBI3364390.1 PHP domain-containing protein [Ignavibacteriota bacterium]
MDGRADLHLHTTYSDGSLSPADLVAKVKNAGLSIISITDHDSVGAIDEAIRIGKELGVEVIPGMELSASYQHMEVHILGYFMDYTNRALQESLAIFRENRLKRIARIVDKLNRMNIPLTMESVLANATGDSVGRPHVANALVNEGHVNSYHQAFNKYLADGRPAYEKKDEFSLEDTVQLIAQAGGLSFLAHPGRVVDETLIFQLIKIGLDGIEVKHPSHTPDLEKHYRGIVNEYFLLESGGSDFHGGMKKDDHLLGNISIPVAAVDDMRRRLFARD